MKINIFSVRKILLILCLFICMPAVSNADSLDTDINTPHWEYVMSLDPYNEIYYVDTNTKNMLFPDKNTAIFNICALHDNQCAIMKIGLRFDGDTRKFFYKTEKSILIDRTTKKIIQENNLSSGWEEVADVSAPVTQCFYYIYMKYCQV